MPHSTGLKNRLFSWNLLFLALILGGGGFFWHTNQQQQLLGQLDSQLLSTARNIDFFYSKIAGKNSTPEILCENLSAIRLLSTVVSDISIYTSQGELICVSAEVRHDNQATSPDTIQPSGSISLKTIADNNGYSRSLSYPISKTEKDTFYLSILGDLVGIKKQASISVLIMFLVGIFTLTSFVVLQRKLKSRNLVAIRRLTKIINATETDISPTTFNVTDVAEPEVKKLANSYNNMMLHQTNKLRQARQFAANVTHELRTPLTILRGETELALKNDRDKGQLMQVLGSNLEEISRMSHLIEDLLLLSKGDLGEIPLKMEQQQLNELIVELHHQAQLLATAKNIKVELRCPQEPIFLQADSLRFRQIFLNLLTNAIKYTPDHGTITIELTTTKDNVEIAISDTGIGMDNVHLEPIFSRFYRIDKTGNRNDGGSGLGLAIVKWIVDAHHGSVNVSSSLGQGSKFTVIFPLQQHDPIIESTPGQKTDESGKHKN